MPSDFPFWLQALLCIALLVPVAVYALIVSHVGTGPARWGTRMMRPPLIMLLITPGISIGHGFGIAPMFVMLPTMLLHPGNVINLVIWLVYSICGFLVELWVAQGRVALGSGK